jgi:hypothetical protein
MSATLEFPGCQQNATRQRLRGCTLAMDGVVSM